jgi:anti-sigma B factor antagonist
MHMDVIVSSANGVTVMGLSGSLDGKTAPDVQKQVLSGAEGQDKVILDMSAVTFVSSAGLRVLLLLYRQLKSKGGKIALVGTSEEIKDVMTNTGLINFFLSADSLDQGITALL